MTEHATGVVLPAGHTGSSLFHAVLAEAGGRFPSVLGPAQLPTDPGVFKRTYGAALARFEAARVASPQRVEIARFIVQRTQAALEYATARGERTELSAYLAGEAPVPALERTVLAGAAGAPVEVPFEGRVYRGREVIGLVDRLYDAHQLTTAARAALHWIVEHALAQGGRIDLSEERFVLFGAGAELASTRMLLRAGASVLWVDLAEPARALGRLDELAGSIARAPEACDLLAQPRAIAAAIRAFAVDGPVHVGMFAYAPGASQEWRLGAVMNALVASLEPALVRSVALLVSPTTASVLTPETVRGAAERLARQPAWQRMLERLGALQRPGHYSAQGVDVSLSTVTVQGLSYQAAQYISKIAAAESYAVFGTRGAAEGSPPVTVSANVAGITRTRSLSHPLFQAAFAGAHRFGVRIFEPATTRALSGLLMLHDLLNPAAPGTAPAQPLEAHAGARKRNDVAALLSQQVHGGIYSLPFVLDGVIRVAAVVGLAGRPSLLLGKRPQPARDEQALAAE